MFAGVGRPGAAGPPPPLGGPWPRPPRLPDGCCSAPPPGAFNYLKENFSNAPSLDMSAPSLSMLVRLMIAQVQECVFEKALLLRAQSGFLTCLQLAQEAARVRQRSACVRVGGGRSGARPKGPGWGAQGSAAKDSRALLGGAGQSAAWMGHLLPAVASWVLLGGPPARQDLSASGSPQQQACKGSLPLNGGTSTC